MSKVNNTHFLCSMISNMLPVSLRGGRRERVGLAWMSYDLAVYRGRCSDGLLQTQTDQQQQRVTIILCAAYCVNSLESMYGTVCTIVRAWPETPD